LPFNPGLIEEARETWVAYERVSDDLLLLGHYDLGEDVEEYFIKVKGLGSMMQGVEDQQVREAALPILDGTSVQNHLSRVDAKAVHRRERVKADAENWRAEAMRLRDGLATLPDQ
jgi:hypothetical protein